MRKAVFILILAALILTQISICPIIDSDREIRKIAYQSIDSKSKEYIIDWETAKVEAYDLDSNHIVMEINDQKAVHMIYLKNKFTYKVTFVTTLDHFVGPLVVYIDRNSYEVLGFDLRL